MHDFYDIHQQPSLTKAQKRSVIALVTLGWLPPIIIHFMMNGDEAVHGKYETITGLSLSFYQLVIGLVTFLIALKIIHILRKFLRESRKENYLTQYGKKTEALCTKIEDNWSKRTLYLKIDGMNVSQTKRCKKNKNGSIPVAYRQFFSLQEGQSIVVYYNPYMPSDFVIPPKISS